MVDALLPRVELLESTSLENLSSVNARLQGARAKRGLVFNEETSCKRRRLGPAEKAKLTGQDIEQLPDNLRRGLMLLMDFQEKSLMLHKLMIGEENSYRCRGSLVVRTCEEYQVSQKCVRELVATGDKGGLSDAIKVRDEKRRAYHDAIANLLAECDAKQGLVWQSCVETKQLVGSLDVIMDDDNAADENNDMAEEEKEDENEEEEEEEEVAEQDGALSEPAESPSFAFRSACIENTMADDQITAISDEFLRRLYAGDMTVDDIVDAMLQFSSGGQLSPVYDCIGDVDRYS